MATRKKKNNIGAFGHPIYGKGFAKYGEVRTNGSSEIPNDLEEAAEKFARLYDQGTCDGIAQDCFIAGAKWQEEQDLKFISEIYQNGYNLCKEQMMKDAVECVVYAGMEGDKWIMTYIGSYESMLKTCKAGDKVRIIICKKED